MAYGFQLTSWCNNKIEIWLIFQCMFKFWSCLDPNVLPLVSMIHIFLDMVNLPSTFFWAFRICFYIKHEKSIPSFSFVIKKWNPKTLHLQKQIDTNRWFVISKLTKKIHFTNKNWPSFFLIALHISLPYIWANWHATCPHNTYNLNMDQHVNNSFKNKTWKNKIKNDHK